MGWTISGLESGQEQEIFSVHHSVPIGSGDLPATIFSGCQSSFLRVKPQGLEEDHLHLVPRLRMSGAVALHLLHAFVA
jgi:hypothetical protein